MALGHAFNLNTDHHGIYDAYPTQTTMACHDNNHPQAPSTPVPSQNSLTKSPTDESTKNCTKKSYDNIENDRPDDDDDNNNNNNDDDVDCFPRQDKQPVLPQQDISPTATTANNTSPSLIESSTDKRTIQRTTAARTKQSAYRGFRKPTHTVVPKAPLLVWYGTQYQLDYNHDHRPISAWDGTTRTNIVYDDDDDYNGTNDYAYGDPFNMNDSSNQLQFTQCLKTVQFQKRLQAAQHIDTTTKNMHASHTASHNTNHNNHPKQTHDDETHKRRPDIVHV